MRGRSIVGPFVLISIGAIFLLNNIRPELNLFSLFAKYWPFLLIGLGVLRLLEVLAYAAGSKPLPMRGLSRGAASLGTVPRRAAHDGYIRRVVRLPCVAAEGDRRQIAHSV
jgi:hypothetical protein